MPAAACQQTVVFGSRGRQEPHIALGWCVVAANVQPQLPTSGLLPCGVAVCVRASAVCVRFPAAQHATASIWSCIMGRLVGQHAPVLKPGNRTRGTQGAAGTFLGWPLCMHRAQCLCELWALFVALAWPVHGAMNGRPVVLQPSRPHFHASRGVVWGPFLSSCHWRASSFVQRCTCVEVGIVTCC